MTQLIFSMAVFASLSQIASATPESCVGTSILSDSIYRIQTSETGEVINLDKKTEKKLCSLDPHSEQTAVCVKTYSTNPALEYFEIPEGQTKASMESINCKGEFKRQAKFKLSTSCSYVPSILGYYQLSRYLGNVLHVPVAVLKTYDYNSELEKIDKGISLTEGMRGWIHKNWETFKQEIKGKRPAVVTQEGDLVYGALVDSKKSFPYYDALFGADINAGMFSWKSTNLKLLNDSSEIRKMISTSLTAGNVQQMQALMDMSEILVMDYIMNQFDRYGNIDYRYFDMSLGANGVEIKPFDEAQPLADGHFKIKRAVLKDNDCGVAFGNITKRKELLKKISHINADFYQRLMAFNSRLPELKEFFTKELLFSEKDFNSISTNTNEITSSLRSLCRSGDLRLDLNWVHFSPEKENSYSCQ